MDTHGHGRLTGLMRYHLCSKFDGVYLSPPPSCMDAFSLTHQCLSPQCQWWSPPVPRMGHCLPVMLRRAPWYVAPDPGLIGIILLPVDVWGSAGFFPDFLCQTGSAVFRLARGEEHMVKYPMGSYASRCFCIGLRHCCVLVTVTDNPGKWNKVAAGHQVWGLGTTRMCAESWLLVTGPWLSQMLPLELVCMGRLTMLIKYAQESET